MYVHSPRVEIFQDTQSGVQPVALAHEALGYIATIVGPLDTVDDQRRIRLVNNPEQPYVDFDNVRWPRFSADANIVLTDRAILRDGKTIPAPERAAQARRGPSGLSQGNLALINTRGSTAVRSAIVHEFGHMYGLKKEGANADKNSLHCAVRSCVMRPYINQVPRSFMSAAEVVLERPNPKGPDAAKLPLDLGQRHFCDECAGQLARAVVLRSLGIDHP